MRVGERVSRGLQLLGVVGNSEVLQKDVPPMENKRRGKGVHAWANER